jgi:uncharacterized protein YdcH (DUF465 family)
MPSTVEDRERLAKTDANFRRLSLKHRQYEERLQELQRRKYLSEDEQLEEVKLKKLKLSLKDQMEAILRKTSH